MPLKDIIDSELSIVPEQDIAELRQPKTDIELKESFKLGLGVSDLFGASMERDSLAVMAYDAVQDTVESSGTERDLNFDDKAKSELFDLHYKDKIHPDLKDDFMSSSRSAKHMEGMYDEYYTSSAKLRYLEEQGFMTQLGLGAVAEITNAPIYIGATYLFPMTATVAGSTAMARFVVSGSAGAVLEGAKELVGRQDKTIADYAGAVLFDGTLGAMFGKGTNPFNDIANNMVLKEHGIDKATLSKIDKSATKEERIDLIAKAYQKHTDKKADMTLLDTLDNNAKYANKNFIQKGWESLRQDMAYVTGKSESESMAGFSNGMFADPTGQDIRPDFRDMATMRDRLEETMRGERQQAFDGLKKEFSRLAFNSNGFLGIKVDTSVEKTYSKILGEIQLERNIHKISPEEAVFKAMDSFGLDRANKELIDVLIKSTDQMSHLATKYHKMLGEAGHIDFKVREDGTTAIPLDDTYTRFVYDKNVFANLINKGYEPKDFINFFKSAINSPKVRAKPIEGEMLDNIAGAFYSAISKSKTDSRGTFSEILSDIKKETTNVDVKNMIDDMLDSKFDTSGEVAGTSARARTNIDYSYSQEYVIDGQKTELKFSDLLSKDYVGNMDNYTRKMAGTTALQSHKFIEIVQPKSKEVVTKEAMESPEIKALLEKQQNFEALKNTLGVKQEELDLLMKQADDIADATEIDELKAFVKSLTDEVKDSASIQKQIDNLVSSKLGKAGIRTSSRQMAFDLSQALKIKNIANRKKAVNDLIESMKKDNPENALEIEEMAKGINARFKKAGKESFNKAVEEFKKIHGDKKLDTKTDAFKEIHKAIKERDVVSLSDFEKRFKEMDVRQPISKERNLHTTKDYEDLRTQITKELQAKVDSGKITESAMNNDLVRFDTIIKNMSGVPTAKEPASGWNRAYRIAHSYNVGRLLGQTFFTMPAEALNVAWDVGLRNFMSSLPSMRHLLSAYKNGTIKNAEILEIQQGLGLYDEFLSGARLYEFEHDFSAVREANKGRLGKTVDKLEEWGEKFSEFTLMTGGIKPLTAWFQTAHVSGVFKKMSKVANGGKKSNSYKKMTRELGLSEKMEEAVYESIRLNSKDGLMHFDKWNADVKNVFLDGVKRRTDTLVQMQRIGDQMSWVTSQDYMMKDTIIGKYIFELKQFVMTSYTKQLGRAINRKDMYIVGLISAQMMALSLAYITKQGYNYAGNEEKLRKSLQPENIVGGTLGMMPQSGLLSMIANFGSQLLTGENIIGQSRHSNVATGAFASLPVVDLAGKLIDTMGIPVKIASGQFEKTDLKAPAGITGLSNNALTRPLFEKFQAK